MVTDLSSVKSDESLICSGLQIDPFRARWTVLAGSCTALALSWGIAGSMPVFYPSLLDWFAWTRTQVVSIGSVRTLVLALVNALVIGAILQKYSTRKILLVGTACLAFSFLALGSMKFLWQGCLISALMGISSAAIGHVPNQVLISRWFTKNRGLAIGLNQAAVSIGSSVGPICIAWPIAHWGWRGAAMISGAFLVVVPFAIILIAVRDDPVSREKREVSKRQEKDRRIQAASFKNPVVLLLATGVLLVSLQMFAVTNHFIFYLRDLGFNMQRAALGLSIMNGAAVLGRFGWAWMCDLLSPRRLFIVNCIIMNMAALSLFAPPQYASYWAWIFAVAFGLCYGGLSGLLPMVGIEYFGSESLGKAYGLLLAVSGLGASLGPLLSGLLFDLTRSYRVPFIVNIGSTFGGMLIFWFLMPQFPSQRTSE